MEQVNNYLKKASLGLVLLMLVAIPNLNVYSSIGSYQITSLAIMANKKRSHVFTTSLCHPSPLYIEDTESYVRQIMEGLPETMKNMFMVFSSNSKPVSISNYLTENYPKYDFSGFDN